MNLPTFIELTVFITTGVQIVYKYIDYAGKTYLLCVYIYIYIYILQIRQGHNSLFQFLVFSLRVLKEDAPLMFSGIRFNICGALYVIVSVPY